MILLREAVQGAVVKYSERYLEQKPNIRTSLQERFGHIVRFSQNATGEVVIMVLWCDEEKPIPTHPANIHIVS